MGFLVLDSIQYSGIEWTKIQLVLCCPFNARILWKFSKILTGFCNHQFQALWPFLFTSCFLVFLWMGEVTVYLKHFHVDFFFPSWKTQQIFCYSHIQIRWGETALFFGGEGRGNVNYPLKNLFHKLGDLSVSPVLFPELFIYSYWLLMAGGKGKTKGILFDSFLAALI